VVWREFAARATGGSPQKFARPDHRQAFLERRAPLARGASRRARLDCGEIALLTSSVMSQSDLRRYNQASSERRPCSGSGARPLPASPQVDPSIA